MKRDVAGPLPFLMSGKEVSDVGCGGEWKGGRKSWLTDGSHEVGHFDIVFNESLISVLRLDLCYEVVWCSFFEDGSRWLRCPRW